VFAQGAVWDTSNDDAGYRREPSKENRDPACFMIRASGHGRVQTCTQFHNRFLERCTKIANSLFIP